MSKNNSFDDVMSERLHDTRPEGLTHAEREYAWMSMRARLTPQKSGWFNLAHSFRKLAAILIIGVTLMGTGIATASAHEGILPGDVLFPVAIATEKAQILLALDPAKKESLRIKFAERRLAEVRTLVKSDPSIVHVNVVSTSSASTTPSTVSTSTPPSDAAMNASTTNDVVASNDFSQEDKVRITRAKRGVAVALRELETTRASLESENAHDGVAIVSDIIDELRTVERGHSRERGDRDDNKQEEAGVSAPVIQAATNTPVLPAQTQRAHERRRSDKNLPKHEGLLVTPIVASTTPTTPQPSTEASIATSSETITPPSIQERREAERRGRNRWQDRLTSVCHEENGIRTTLTLRVPEARRALQRGDLLGACEVPPPTIEQAPATPTEQVDQQDNGEQRWERGGRDSGHDD